MTTQAILLLVIATHEAAADIRTVAPDLHVPMVTPGPIAAGKRCHEVLAEYAGTQVYHVTYLPTDWQPGGKFPLIVEYAGNGNYQSPEGDICTGRMQESKLGYGISRGKGFIWVCLPYLNAAGTSAVSTWWGTPPHNNPQATIDYCKQAIPWVCEKYGGDPKHILLAGFSRGAIACNFIGLHDPEIAKLWCGFVVYSHYDGVVNNWSYPGCDRKSARSRLERLGQRPQFICAEGTAGKQSVTATKSYLNSTGIQGNFRFQATGFRNHNDAWVLRPSPAREVLRDWVRQVLQEHQQQH